MIPAFEFNAIYFNIERSHRQHSSKTSKSEYKKLVIIAKFVT